jgi:2-dehydro-3-deoxygalactonokinase
MTDSFLAADWGTSNLRAWVIDPDGSVRDVRKFPWGVARLQHGEAQAALDDEVRPALGAEDLPALLCGMIGSNLGLAAVPYVDCPVDASTLAGRLYEVEKTAGAPVRIVPGLRCRRPNGDPDVIRGEETKVLGWLAEDPDRRRGEQLLCLPGTHCKWIQIVDGRIERFLTAMSGELFEVLGRHGVLKSEAIADNEAVFDEGLAAGAADGALASRLFAARSRVVGGDMPAQDARSYLSGLLIGDEASKMVRDFQPKGRIVLLGEPALCRWYERALTRLGVEIESDPGDEAVITGLTILQREGGAA